MILPISLTAAAAAALINIWLAVRIGRIRTTEKISIGDGGNELLVRRMRAQANFVEFTPFVLILIVLLEMATGTSLVLWGVMAIYMIGRILHALGMDGKLNTRPVAIAITMLVLLGLALYAVYVAQASEGRIMAPAENTETLPAG
jgi:uncharacterized protein